MVTTPLRRLDSGRRQGLLPERLPPEGGAEVVRRLLGGRCQATWGRGARSGGRRHEFLRLVAVRLLGGGERRPFAERQDEALAVAVRDRGHGLAGRDGERVLGQPL